MLCYAAAAAAAVAAAAGTVTTTVVVVGDPSATVTMGTLPPAAGMGMMMMFPASPAAGVAVSVAWGGR